MLAGQPLHASTPASQHARCLYETPTHGLLAWAQRLLCMAAVHGRALALCSLMCRPAPCGQRSARFGGPATPQHKGRRVMQRQAWPHGAGIGRKRRCMHGT